MDNIWYWIVGFAAVWFVILMLICISEINTKRVNHPLPFYIEDMGNEFRIRNRSAGRAFGRTTKR